MALDFTLALEIHNRYPQWMKDKYERVGCGYAWLYAFKSVNRSAHHTVTSSRKLTKILLFLIGTVLLLLEILGLYLTEILGL